MLYKYLMSPWETKIWGTETIIPQYNELGLTKAVVGASLIAQSLKNLPAVQEIWVQFLGREDTLEKGMATHSSIPAWRIPWTEEPDRLQSMESQELDTI